MYKPVLIIGSLQTHAVMVRVHGGGILPVSELRTSDCRVSSRCVIAGRVWKSRQNGLVYDPCGVAPTICVGHHSGVEPKIIEYEKD